MYASADLAAATSVVPRQASAGVAATGLSWAPPVTIDTQTLTSVSCPSDKFCMATDDIGQAVEYLGGKWGKPVDVDGGSITHELPLGSVSCASPTFCEAVVSDGRMAKFDGTKWSLSPQPGYSGYAFNSVSCASSHFCVAVGGPTGDFAAYNGTRWGPAGTADPGGNLATVSCPTSSFCMAVNLNSDQVNLFTASSRTYNGKKWSSSVAMPSGFGNGQAISCLASRFCAAIDDGGDAAVYSGRSWAHAATIDAGALQTVAISCASKRFCVVVDQKGSALTYNGARWSGRKVIDRQGLAPGFPAIMAGVSCPSPMFCVAVGGRDAVIGR